VILDNQCQISEGTLIGADLDGDRQAYHVTENGVVVVNRKQLGQGERYMPGVLQRGPCEPEGPKKGR
jgi:glucose-1-phosphate adenylyltransferase